MQFALAVAAPLAVHCWEEQCVLFDPASGDTHQMSWVAVEVLRRLEQAPASADDLFRFFMDEGMSTGSVDDAALHASLIALLTDLECMALVNRA